MNSFLEWLYYAGMVIAATAFVVSGLVAMAAGIIYWLNPYREEEEWE